MPGPEIVTIRSGLLAALLVERLADHVLREGLRSALGGARRVGVARFAEYGRADSANVRRDAYRHVDGHRNAEIVECRDLHVVEEAIQDADVLNVDRDEAVTTAGVHLGKSRGRGHCSGGGGKDHLTHTFLHSIE